MAENDAYASDDRGPAVRTSSEPTQRLLTEFHSGVAQHVAAIQAAGREFLAGHAGERGPREIRVEIAVTPDPDASKTEYDSVDCWDEDVICGKGPTGYIHCTVHVCMTVGPITVAPG